MAGVKWNIIIFIALISGLGGRKLYDDSQNDEDDSLDCNDGRKIDDPILLPFFEKLREQEMIPSRMKEWIIFFDLDESVDLENFGEGWNQTYLTENGLSKDNQSLPFGQVLYGNGKNVYFPKLKPFSDEWEEFRVMYAEQLLLDAMDEVKIYIKYDPTVEYQSPLSKSAGRMLQKIMKRSSVEKIYVVSSQCDGKCRRVKDNPLIKLATCGSGFGKSLEIECKNPEEDIFEGSEAGHYKSVSEPEFQVDLPKNLKQELHKIMDWLLNRIAQRMKNYMEMAFAKNRFRKTPADVYNKVNLQISKIRGGQTFEASKSAELIYNSLFDLNVYLNVTNTPYTFDKFASFNRYLKFIGRFSKWQLDTTKYANFFEPHKEICLRYIGSGALLMKPATKIFQLEEGVYDLIGAICHENVLYIINGLTTMNTIKSGIYDNGNCQFDTVFVLAKKNLTINEDLRIPGKNLVIFAPAWIIVKEQTIDLSGDAGNSNEAGTSGGDFFGFGTKFERSDLLTVISNGGDGGRGRDVEEVVDPVFFAMKGKKCVAKKTEMLKKRYGATHGAPGGSPGAITFKIIRNPVMNVTVVQNDGQKGEDGVMKGITGRCGSKTATVPVQHLEDGNFTTKQIQKMKESEILELFRKIIRKNSRRLSYEVLTFYKDIWTAPIMGQTLDSTLRDFLNASDYTKDSREFYEITSQILHAQIKYSCNMTEPQRVLLDFALTTIRMEAPIEGVLPSVIDIDGYLKEVSDWVGRTEISSEYFERKEAKFRKVIEEANNYLNVSLLPSLRETIEGMHEYLQEEQSYYMSPDGDQSEEHFQEILVMNSLLRHLATLFEHVQLSLNDFVTPFEGSDVGELNSESLQRKLYFYRHVRNNMTVNQMNAMKEFLKLLENGVEGETVLTEKMCFDCKKEVNNMLKDMMALEPKNEECHRVAKDLQGHLEVPKKVRFGGVNCRECGGNCQLCGWCRSCQMRCSSCNDCEECPWCLKCILDARPEYCSDCPDCPGCGFPTNSSACSDCGDCRTCPSCEKCEEDLDHVCDACQDCDLCPECPHCTGLSSDEDCRHCQDCVLCPNCIQCRSRKTTLSDCDTCTDCVLCPNCIQCRARKGTPSDCDTCTDCVLCPNCIQCRVSRRGSSDCDTCTDCVLCPNCIQCRARKGTPSDCDTCTDCVLCPNCIQCRVSRRGSSDCDTCTDCVLCPNCIQCRIRQEISPDCTTCPECQGCKTALIRNRRFFSGAQLCRRCPCSACRSCPGCQLRPEFDEIDRDVFFSLNSWRSVPENRMFPPPRRTHVPAAQQRREEFARAIAAYLRLFRARSQSINRANTDRGTKPKKSHFLRNSLPDDQSVWRKCLTTVGSHLDELFEQSNETCNIKTQIACSITLKSLREMNKEDAVRKKTGIRFKCTDCNDTLDYFIERLTSEVEKCEGDSNFNYRESESMCAPNEGVLFHMSGCDPETFSRTYDEIRDNFLKEFSRFVADQSDELNGIPRNFVYLLTNVDILLAEGIPLTEENIYGILRVTDSLVRFKDLKTEYEKKMTELHDFSETDVYDLFTAELSMQNERLDLTSKWLSQLKKLVPWIRKVTAFLATNLKFQEVNEKILEAVRLVSEIVHNVKVVEHYRNLRDYMNRVKNVDKIRAKGVSKFKPVFQKTFTTDVFNKAVKISENWMFPLTKSVTELRDTLREMKNSTYREQLDVVATEIDDHRKAISLYTSTQSLDTNEKKSFFYKWNIKTRPTLLNDLFSGKPVILVSEILDGGRMNSLMAKNFEMKLVAGRRQKEGTQQEIDAALEGSWLNVTHSGISYFKFGSRIYRRLTETFTFRQPAAILNGTETDQKIDFVLSPYTTWILRLESEAGRFPVKIKERIGRIELYGTGRYVVNCADIPDVNQNFYPLTDYRRRNGK